MNVILPILGAGVLVLLIAAGISWIWNNVKIHPGYRYEEDGKVKDLREDEDS